MVYFEFELSLAIVVRCYLVNQQANLTTPLFIGLLGLAAEVNLAASLPHNYIALEYCGCKADLPGGINNSAGVPNVSHRDFRVLVKPYMSMAIIQ